MSIFNELVLANNSVFNTNSFLNTFLTIPVPIVDVTIEGGNGDEVLDGTADDDDIDGNGGDDIINGLGGNDFLEGGSGDDVLNGGTGNDSLTGGWGADRYVFNEGDGVDVITDFEKWNDKVDLTSFGFDGFEDLNLVESDIGTVVLVLSEDQSIEFTNLDDVSDLSASDFLF